MTTFIDQLDAAATRNRSLLCVGLDPWRPSLPIEDIAEFNSAIIAATSDLVCAYKPQWAFYEAEGFAGLEALQQTIAAVPDGIPVILDVKRGDLGSVSTAYAKAAFEVWGAGRGYREPVHGARFDPAVPRLRRPGRVRYRAHLQPRSDGVPVPWRGRNRGVYVGGQARSAAALAHP